MRGNATRIRQLSLQIASHKDIFDKQTKNLLKLEHSQQIDKLVIEMSKLAKDYEFSVSMMAPERQYEQRSEIDF